MILAELAGGGLFDGALSESAARLGTAVVLGAAIGLERQFHGRAAGLRTMLLVCLGSCLVMLTSLHFQTIFGDASPDRSAVQVDPARLAYSVMGGIGFIGAGVILKSGLSVRGLTTAASIWCVAAVGLAVGFGMYAVAVISAALVILALFALELAEVRILDPLHRRVKLTVGVEAGPQLRKDFLLRLGAAGMVVLDHAYRHEAADGRAELTCQVRLRRHCDLDRLYELIEAVPEIRAFSVD